MTNEIHLPNGRGETGGRTYGEKSSPRLSDSNRCYCHKIVCTIIIDDIHLFEILLNIFSYFTVCKHCAILIRKQILYGSDFLRVIAGNNKGIKIIPVPGLNTRPTTDRVKESIFNIIGPYFSEGEVLDLFAGSGGLGIEALSRGASNAVFIDKSNAAIETIRKNLQQTKLFDKSKIYKVDWKTACDKLSKLECKFSYVFIDPPYTEYQQKIPVIITQLIEKKLLQKNAIIICEHESQFKPSVNVCNFVGRYYKYGNTGLTVYEEAEEL